QFRAAAATPGIPRGPAAPGSQSGPSVATARLGPPGSTAGRVPPPRGPGAILPPSRESLPPRSPSPELTSRLCARSLRLSSSSGSGASDHSDSLTAALRSATELCAPPSRRPDQQMGGAAPPPGFHWTGRREAVPETGTRRLVSCRVSSQCGAPADRLCLSVHHPPSRGAPS
uniref:Uncharacterized protein n=1 Tax=Nannospalax galili TaxID=1026970 RepID=A0A8C6QXQ1_NANGA